MHVRRCSWHRSAHRAGAWPLAAPPRLSPGSGQRMRGPGFAWAQPVRPLPGRHQGTPSALEVEMHGVWLPSQLDPPIAVDAASPASLCSVFPSPPPFP